LNCEPDLERTLTVETQAGTAILVNGDSVKTAAHNLAELVAELGLSGARVATARNGDFVPERQRTATVVEPGDRIEIVSPRHGG
jgi:sulfur carrier protein